MPKGTTFQILKTTLKKNNKWQILEGSDSNFYSTALDKPER